MSSVYRTQIHEAYTYIRSIEAGKAVSPITLDHLIQKQIQFLKTGSSRPLIDARGENSNYGRISRYDQLKAIKENIQAIVADIKKVGDDPTQLEDKGLTSPSPDDSNQFPTLKLPDAT